MVDVGQALATLREHYEKITPNVPLSKSLYDVCNRRAFLRVLHIFEEKPGHSKTREQARRSREMSSLLDECKKLGWTVFELHPKSRAPIEFKKELTNGALTVRMCAIAHETGKPGWFLIEVASVADEHFLEIVSQKLEKAYPALYGHCILGLGFSKLSSCYVFLSSDSGEVYIEMIKANPDLFNRLIALAEDVIDGKIPEPYPIPECQSCNYESLCFNPNTIPEPSCYTCDYKSGTHEVQCLKWQKPIPETDRRDGCLAHLYNPKLVNFGKWKSKVILENDEFGHIYEINGKNILNCSTRATKHIDQTQHGLLFTSRELFIGGVASITHPQVQAIKEQFAGSKIIDFTHNKEEDDHQT